jgi:hypothetical protein
MTGWCRKLVLLLGLAVMPFQGIGATLSVLYCHGESGAHAMHETGGHDHGTSHHDSNDRHDDGSATGNPADHLCCHFSVSAPLTVTLPAAQADFPVRAFAPDPLHDPFFPDRPQRPPLA